MQLIFPFSHPRLWLLILQRPATTAVTADRTPPVCFAFNASPRASTSSTGTISWLSDATEICLTYTLSVTTQSRYRMSTSDGGGYCDCGDAEAWQSFPSCELHTQSSSEGRTADEVMKCWSFCSILYLISDLLGWLITLHKKENGDSFGISGKKLSVRKSVLQIDIE